MMQLESLAEVFWYMKGASFLRGDYRWKIEKKTFGILIIYLYGTFSDRAEIFTKAV